MPISVEMLAWISILLSVLALALIAVVWRNIEARMAHGFHLRAEEVTAIRRSLAFELPSTAVHTSVSSSKEERPPSSGNARPDGLSTAESAAKPLELPLAPQIADFIQALGRWCQAAGHTPTEAAMQDRKLKLERLVRDAMSDRIARSMLDAQFAKEAVDIVKAVVSATDKDFMDDPRHGELEEQLMVLVNGARLALIDPAPGTPLDRDRHESRGGSAREGSGRETVAAVLSRGVERLSAAKRSSDGVLAKAEVVVNY